MSWKIQKSENPFQTYYIKNLKMMAHKNNINNKNRFQNNKKNNYSKKKINIKKIHITNNKSPWKLK